VEVLPIIEELELGSYNKYTAEEDISIGSEGVQQGT